MRIVAVTQARTGSTRLPSKVLKEVLGMSLLQLHVRRVLGSKMINELIVATTTLPEDLAIVTAAKDLRIRTFQGSVDDVLDRFYQAVKAEPADYVVRLTSDCPLIDPQLIDNVIQYTIDQNLDYCSNALTPQFPDGQDVEVFKYSALEKAWREAELVSEREHVTPYIWKNSSYKGGSLFISDNFGTPNAYGHLRMTVDEPADLEVIRKVVEAIGFDKSWAEYAQWLEDNRQVRGLNETIGRNEGYNKSLDKEN